jgi:hypothetical protein
LDGVWASGAAPQEFVDWQLMREMRISWAQLQETPEYVKTYCWDFMMAERRARRSEQENQRRAAEEASGVRRVRR